MKKLAFYLLMIPLFGIGMTSCSEEGNGTDTPETPQEDSVYVEDELAILQNYLVKVDEEGNLVERLWGEVLDEAAPDEVTVGVDSLAQAVAIFKGLFADTTVISEDGMLATFSVQEGSAELKVANGENGLVAYATFDVPGLMYVSRINFILNSAWPENATAKGFHKLGVFYEYKGYTDSDKLYKYLCIREYGNGKPALLFAIGTTPIYLNWLDEDEKMGNMPRENKAKEISTILRGDWDYYEKHMNTEYGCTALKKGWEYWYRDGIFAVFYNATYYINLSTGETDSEWVIGWEPRSSLFYMESGQKM
ncbi:MAG: hypothetical protein IKU98_05540 [Bacteroidaceae bacterium]|nr:hypothetical protein [Bacteroidaceae bacterium]